MGIEANLTIAVVGMIHDALAATVPVPSSCMRSCTGSVAKTKKYDI
jgi:hypothetical protein